MSRNAVHVAEAFISGEYAQAGAFAAMGDAIYSYGLKLAWRDSDGGIIFTDEMQGYFDGTYKASRTTAGHINAVANAASGALQAETIPSYGTLTVAANLAHEENLRRQRANAAKAV